MVLRYDRRAPTELMEALGPEGFAHSLVEYGRSGAYWLDLQLRGYENGADHWATLYVGLTKVLDLDYLTSKGFRLGAHPTHGNPENGWQTEWQRRHSAEWWAQRWPQVEDYLEGVIPKVGAPHLKEGAVQAAIGGFESADRIVIDREGVVTFDSDPEKKAASEHLRRPLLDALERSDPPAWWTGRPKTLGGECDALAINAAGELLTIEVKPADSNTLPWALVQVMHYANLFRAWAAQPPAKGRPAPAAVLQGMLDQRRNLGLVRNSGAFQVADPVVVRPVLAFDRRASVAARKRLLEVASHLQSQDINVDVEMYEVNRIGRLDRWPSADSADEDGKASH
jgi:hypothetical protein